MTSPTLKRAVSLPELTLFGLGTILGAGVYVLIGKVGAIAGPLTPVAFMVAALVAAFTALSYAELSSRFPESAGEVAFVKYAFPIRALTIATGWAVIANGTISAATMATGFTGYLSVFVAVTPWLAIVLLVITLGLLAAWGIKESVSVAVVITLIEVLGLGFVITVGADRVPELPEVFARADIHESYGWLAVLSGAQLAFYAYIGFEDMVNIAEEVHRPRRTVPLGLVVALGISTLMYILVGVVAVTNLTPAQLAESEAPFADLLAGQGFSPQSIAAISLLAIVNGALVQIIMAARVLYGMGRHGLASRRFAAVHSRTRTPVRATVLVTAIILSAALWLPLETLARLASAIALGLFALVNAALLVVRRRPAPPGSRLRCPAWVPFGGILTCLVLLAVGLVELLGR